MTVGSRVEWTDGIESEDRLIGDRREGLAINRIASDCDGLIGGARMNFVIAIGYPR